MQTIEEASLEKHPVIHHYALNNIFEIIKLISDRTEDIARILKNVPYYVTKAKIKKYVAYNLIKRIQPDVYIDPENPTVVYGNSIDETISYFSSEAKDKKSICDSLDASFKQLLKHK